MPTDAADVAAPVIVAAAPACMHIPWCHSLGGLARAPSGRGVAGGRLKR